MRKSMFALALLSATGLSGTLMAAKATPILLGFGTSTPGAFVDYTKSGFRVANAGADHWIVSGTLFCLHQDRQYADVI